MSLSKSRKRFDGIQIRCQFIKYLVSEAEDQAYEAHLPESDQSAVGNSGSPPLITEYIYSPGVSHYFISGLRRFSLYELSIQPFLRGAAPNEPMFAAVVERFNTPEDGKLLLNIHEDFYEYLLCIYYSKCQPRLRWGFRLTCSTTIPSSDSHGNRHSFKTWMESSLAIRSAW